MGEIVWLASYPKSGNTWVRMFLNTYFWGEDAKQDLTTYGGSSKSSYAQVTSRAVNELSDAEIMAHTPSAHAYIASQT
ncbi:MAG: hypothetical protein JKX94_11735 [Sneathiella sp.]|nr:hypothetical protein [Sneathiella sp.]